MKTLKISVLVFSLTVLFAFQIKAEELDEYEPTKYGMSGILGYTFDPSDNTFFTQVSFCAIYDYDRIWFHPAPKDLRFKVEASVGLSYLENGDVRIISNVGMLALYYLNSLSGDKIKPYVEAGIGLIYTDYRVNEQAYRFNFNPQGGIGFEFKRKSGHTNFLAFRIHHLSNGGINEDNRGQNSVVMMFGQYF